MQNANAKNRRPELEDEYQLLQFINLVAFHVRFQVGSFTCAPCCFALSGKRSSLAAERDDLPGGRARDAATSGAQAHHQPSGGRA